MAKERKEKEEKMRQENLKNKNQLKQKMKEIYKEIQSEKV